jgi:hypothetical protein
VWVAGVLAAGAADQPAGDDAELWIAFCIVYFLWCGLQVSSLQERLTSLQETMLNFGLCSVLFTFFGVVSGVLAAGAADQPAGDDAELWIAFCIVYFLWCGLQVSSLQERLTSLQETMLNVMDKYGNLARLEHLHLRNLRENNSQNLPSKSVS